MSPLGNKLKDGELPSGSGETPWDFKVQFATNCECFSSVDVFKLWLLYDELNDVELPGDADMGPRILHQYPLFLQSCKSGDGLLYDKLKDMELPGDPGKTPGSKIERSVDILR